MELYLAGNDVTNAIELADSFGNQLTVDALEYEVVNQTGAAVVERQPVTGFTPGDALVTIVVPASANLLSGLETRETRRINLYCSVAGNTVQIRKLYAVEASDVLEVGVNSFQTYDEAELIALEIPNLNGWDAASYKEKLAAMMEARLRICKMNFSLLNSNSWGLDSLNYIPEGTFISPYAGVFNFNGDLTFIPPESFKNLPPRFLKALKLAQLAEANQITGLANGSIIDKRAQYPGLVEDTVGESKQVFSGGKPLNIGISREAARYLASFINYNLRTGRS